MLKKLLLSLCCILTLTVTSVIAEGNPKVLLSTSMGDIELELDQQKAPITVANFLSYVDSGFYNGTIFHRVISSFMVQGGGFEEDMSQKSTLPAIKNEADNNLPNIRGSIAMARTSIVDSATSQFFINVKNNSFLNHNEHDFGYAVFGTVIRGMDVVDNISKVNTTRRKGAQDVPINPIIIITAKRI